MKAIIIDDEENNRITLKNFISRYTPDVEIIGEAESVVQGNELLGQSGPDLVFLDIQLKDGTGFDLLKKLSHRNFHLIFVTAFDQYAITAFRYSAIDYILKPVDPDHLIEAVNKCSSLTRHTSSEKINVLLDNADTLSKIAIPTQQGIEFISTDSIIRCQSDSNYTIIHMLNNRRLMASKTLKEFEELLSPAGFYRIHKSHLVNLKHIERYVQRDNGYIEMCDKSEIDISRRKKDEFLKIMTRKSV